MRHPPALNVTIAAALRQQTMLKSQLTKLHLHLIDCWFEFISIVRSLCYGDKIDKFIFFYPPHMVYTFSNLKKK